MKIRTQIIIGSLIILGSFILTTNSSADQIDVQQLDYDNDIAYPLQQSYYFTQSYIPGKEVFTRYFLRMSKSSSTYSANVDIFTALKLKPWTPLRYDDLVWIEPVPSSGNSFIEIDIEDVNTIPSEEIYFGIHGTGSESIRYDWYADQDNPYSSGEGWRSDNGLNGNWYSVSPHDFSFKTYGDSRLKDPDIRVNPTTLTGKTYQGGQIQREFWVYNDGDQAQSGSQLVWKIDDYPSFITDISPQGGKLNYGGQQKVTVIMSTEPGDPQQPYSGNIIIKSNGGSEIVSIVFEISYANFISESASVYQVINENIYCVVGQQYQFYGTVGGGTAPYNWSWDFGESNTSFNQNPIKSYSQIDEYILNFTVTDSDSKVTYMVRNVSVVPLKSDYNLSPDFYINKNETISFTDNSSYMENNYITNWVWDFGDGNYSYTQNSTHSYNEDGIYSVTLNITDNQNNTSEITKIIYVDSIAPEIHMIFTNPKVVDYDENVTISAYVCDWENLLKEVKINITDPNGNYSNNSMISNSHNIYHYSFTNTTVNGEYNFKIWLVDEAGNMNSSSNNSFFTPHYFGEDTIGNQNQSITNRITGSIYQIYEYGKADNITAYVYGTNNDSPTYQCLIYRENDSMFIGKTDGKTINSTGWHTFSFNSSNRPNLTRYSNYILACWGNTNASLYYQNNSNFGRYNNSTYNSSSPPNQPNFNNESRIYSIYCSYTPDSSPPILENISIDKSTLGYGYNVSISVNISDNQSGINPLKTFVNMTLPDKSTEYYIMNLKNQNIYECVFENTWQNGIYNFSIESYDYNDNVNISSVYNFTVKANATIDVCTVKDNYTNNQLINLTDPPVSNNNIGYELLCNGEIIRLWNDFDNYYIDTTSGLQLTNHLDDYWSHNVLMLGYYNNDQWKLIYRNDQLTNFTMNINTESETKINITFWKNLEYGSYPFRLAVRYSLGIDDTDLTVVPYIKNTGSEDIPYTLGFGWELKDIMIDMTEENDYIEIDDTSYYLNTTLDNTYTDLDEAWFYIREDIDTDNSKSLYLIWDNDLNYKVTVKSRDGQYNAPVTLFIRIGTLAVGQEKSTEIFWHDASESTYYFDSWDETEEWASNPGNMVNGEEESYANTGVDGDVELCNDNSYSTGGVGTISKVEIRVRGYDNGNTQIYLRPVFGGRYDGDNNIFVPSSTKSWSSWYDITDDENGPGVWSWSDIADLDCDVEADISSPFVLAYTSQIEIRVTYTVNNPPGISNPYPSDESIGITLTPKLSIYVSDADDDNMNVSWSSNSSGSWQIFGTNNSVGTGTIYQTFINATANGQWWYWKINVTDGTNYTESSIFKFYTGNQSKIENTGITSFKGYLVIQVHFYNQTSESWVIAHNTINENTTRTFTTSEGPAGGNIFGLDTVFNGIVSANNLSSYGNGSYRIYTALRDPYDNVLKIDDGTKIESTYEFTITYS